MRTQSGWAATQHERTDGDAGLAPVGRPQLHEKTSRAPLTTRKSITRRRFLKTSGLAAGALIVPSSILGTARGGQRRQSAPSERLNIAAVGLGARGLGNVEKCEGSNIVALCDVDWDAAAVAFQQYPDVPKYKDFRKMLDREKSIDGVLISTPDHTHAVIAAAAMKQGKHVFVETPLAHDVWEARELARIARQTGVTTQMGNERHSGPGIRQAVEMVWGGGLGEIRQVHCWTNRPQWPQGIGHPTSQSTVPKNLDWDLWLGPASERSYNVAYHPYRWRGWIDFGTGALGAMGCHLLDMAFWGLKLGEADSYSIEAESTGMNDATYPEASTIRYHFPARGDLAPVTVTWYDGGRQPARPEQLPYLRELGSNGSLLVGDEHSMMFGPTVFGTNPGQIGPRTIPEFLDIKPKKPFQKIASVPEGTWTKGDRHMREWIAACKARKVPCANFEYSAALTEMVLLGNVALRTGSAIDWDAKKMKITNVGEANRLVRREYRSGWSL